jgi:hypothetical protein
MLSSVILGGFLAVIPPTLAQTPAWIHALQSDGYLVKQGKWGYFDTVTCAHSDTCYAINPITPYGLIYLPPHDHETADGNYSNTCHVHGLCKEVDGVVYAPTWRVAPGEVIVLVGRTPPESTYWSFAPSLYTRFYKGGYKPNPKDLAQRIVQCPSPPKDSPGARCEVFSAVNDPLNMETVKVDAATPFNASFSMVIAWDSEAEAAGTKRLSEADVGPVNSLRYPGAISKLGVTHGDEDEFINVMRVEDIKHQTDSDAFYGSTPYEVYRVSLPLDKPPQKESFYSSFDGKMRTRWTGRSESAPNATNEELRDGLQKLKDAVIKENANFFNYHSQDFESFVNDSGYECLDRGLKCQGDCRDTIYAKATMLVEETICNKTHLPCKPSRHAELRNKKNDAFFVMGVNHEMTHQSLYSSVTAYNYPKLGAGILQKASGHQQYTMMADDYAGSATKYVPNHPAAPYLYVVKFARRCSSNEQVLCVDVPMETTDPNITTISEDQPLVFIERMYIHPGTKSGPAVAETVLPVLVHVASLLEDDIVV